MAAWLQALPAWRLDDPGWMAPGRETSEASADLVEIDHYFGCRIYQELSSGQVLVAREQRPGEFWVADGLPGAHALCRRLQALR